MNNNLDSYITELNEHIKDLQNNLNECDKELKNWNYSYTVRTALMGYRLELQEDIERFNNELIKALKQSKDIS